MEGLRREKEGLERELGEIRGKIEAAVEEK